MRYRHKKISASGVLNNDACTFGGFVLGTDGTYDPEITIFDNASAASGEEIAPTTTYDATALGLNGYTAPAGGINCENGIYVEITCTGTVEVVVSYG